MSKEEQATPSTDNLWPEAIVRMSRQWTFEKFCLELGFCEDDDASRGFFFKTQVLAGLLCEGGRATWTSVANTYLAWEFANKLKD